MLVGRRPETEALDRLLVGAREGQSGVLVLRGEAGIGKSALLDHATRAAVGMTVLHGVGIESESELAFAGVHQLLRPALDRIDDLPEPQAAALRAAFALSNETVEDRFRVAVAVLGLLCVLAEEQPVLCVLDDAQWLDHASAETLLFAARRLEAESLAILFGVREDGVSRFPAPGLPELWLRGLSSADARRLATEHATAGMPAETVDWLVAHADGNPLALIELAASDPRAGGAPRTTSVEQTYLERIEALPSSARRLLVLAAADETGDRALIARAADAIGLDPDELAVAEAVGSDPGRHRHGRVPAPARALGGLSQRRFRRARTRTSRTRRRSGESGRCGPARLAPGRRNGRS